MPDKFQNKYTINSTRLKNYDYSQNGMYFVTICTREKEHFFGEIENGKMILNDLGKIAEKFWQEIPKHFSFVNLDEYVVIPNHLHGIVEICRNVDDENSIDNANGCDVINVGDNTNDCDDTNVCVSTGDTIKTGGITGNYNPMLNPFSLSKIIRWYKGVCTFEINKQYSIMFQWQSRFYDRIIRNDESLNKIREYTINNPRMWERDRNNLENIFM